PDADAAGAPGLDGRAARADIGAAPGAAGADAAVRPDRRAGAIAARGDPAARPDRDAAAAHRPEPARQRLRRWGGGEQQRRPDQLRCQPFHDEPRAGVLEVWRGHLPPLTRVTRTGGVPGNAAPPATRSTACQVKASGPSGMRTLTAVTTLPSGSVAAA